ncbi:MAG: nucleotide exchange factor GrpE [Anaerolineae bacterium]
MANNTRDKLAEAEIQEEALADQEETSTGAEEASAKPQSPEDLQAALEAAQAEAAKNLDGWQRAAAELANYKRRQEEQASRRRADAKASILEQLLPVLDDFDLAFQNVPETLGDQEQNWVDGFQLIGRKLNKLLENQGVQVIDTDGQFDPTLHDAITHEESDDHEEGQIIAEVRKGYRMGDRVLRPAMVRVAK